MKKMFSVILAGLMCLSFVGCANSTTERPTNGVSKIWSAIDESVVREVGGLAIDDGWGSIESNDSKAGALTKVTYEAKATVYTFVARLLAKTVSATNTTPVVSMIVRDQTRGGVKLAERLIRSNDFAASMTYQDFSLKFEVPQNAKLSLEVYWPGYTYGRVSEFAIMSKHNTDVPDYKQAPEKMLGVNIEESIEFSQSSLYVFDLATYKNSLFSSEEVYDLANMLAALQGIVNRDGNYLFIKYMQANSFSADTDGYWLEYLTAEGQFLNDKTVVEVQSPMTLLKLFKDKFTGYAVWDEMVPATVNAAATACGVESLLPLRYDSAKDSLFYYMTQLDKTLQKPVKVDLANKFTGSGTIYQTNVKSTGSRKNDAYIWAMTKYLDTELVNPFIVAYHVDAYSKNQTVNLYEDLQNMYLMNKDYYIKNKAFFFDLSPMMYEIPDDDPDQADLDVQNDTTTDYKTFVKIMSRQNKLAAKTDATRSISVGGFTPWHLKYTRFTNPSASPEVDCEWETVFQFSIFNAYVNADAPHYTNMTNASIYENFPMPQSYTQNCDRTKAETAKLPSADEQGANYIMLYMGDYDASAWLNTAMIKMWNDPTRGTIPLVWPLSIDIGKRAPHVFDMMLTTASANDYIVAGDNGAGYLMAEGFTTTLRNQPDYQGLNGSMDTYAAFSKNMMAKYDIDLLGFYITRKAWEDSWLEMAAKISPIGFATNFPTNKQMIGETSMVRSIDITGSAIGAVETIKKAVTTKNVGDASTFLQLRSILWTPSEIYEVVKILQNPENAAYNFQIVDPYTMYALHKQQYAQ